MWAKGKTNQKMSFLDVFLILVVMAGIFLFSHVGQAAPLGLLNLGPPQINFNYAGVSYTYDSGAGTGQLSVSGYVGGGSFAYDDNGTTTWVDIIPNYSSFNLNATVDASGSIITGDFSVSGEVDDLGFHSGTLLTGDLLNRIGFENSTYLLEFLFDPTGGDAQALFESVAPHGGITIDFVNGKPTGPSPWTTDWTPTSNALGSVFPTPIPGAAWLFVSGLMGLLGYKKKLNKK